MNGADLSAEHMADIQRTAYIIEYSPGTSKMWHRSASNPHAGFQTEAQALDTIKRSRSVNSLGKKVRYRLVRVVETRTVLQEVA